MKPAARLSLLSLGLALALSVPAGGAWAAGQGPKAPPALTSELRLDLGAPAAPENETTEAPEVQEAPEALAARLWEAFSEEEDLDPRTDLLELHFAPGASRLPGAVRVTGISAEPALLSKFLARLASRGITAETAIEQVPDEQALKGILWGIVRTGRAPLFNAECTDPKGTQPAGTLLSGDRVRILRRGSEALEGYVLIERPDGRVGWTPAKALAEKNAMAFVAWNRRDAAVITKPGAEVKGLKGEVLMHAPAGTLFMLSSRGGYSWEVYLPDGRDGRVLREDAEYARDWQLREEELRRTSPQAYLKSLADSAEGLAGFPEADLGMPLPAAVLRMHDLIVPIDVDRLARLGAPLSGGRNGSELKPGDLVFFGSGDVPERAGIWLGGGRFAAGNPRTGLVDIFRFGRGARTGKTGQKGKGGQAGAQANADANGGLGNFLWAVRLQPGELRNPCILSTRSHPFYQTPPAALERCRLR